MKNLPIILLCLGLVGCATARLTSQEITEQALAVNKADGIDKNEAILLARKYVIENEGKDQLTERYIIETRHVAKDDPISDKWLVDFSSKYGFFSKEGYQFTLQVWVDKKTGEIKSMHICKY